MKFVLDASVTLSWLLADGKAVDKAYAQKVLDRLKRIDVTAVVPAIWPYEITNVIARAEARAFVSEFQSEAFVELLSELDIDLEIGLPDKAFTDVLQLARRYRLSAYDASYLDVALKQGLPLATLDVELQKAAKKAGIKRFA